MSNSTGNHSTSNVIEIRVLFQLLYVGQLEKGRMPSKHRPKGGASLKHHTVVLTGSG